MLYRVEHLRGYTIRAIDGDIGTVDDILFDDRGWVVRYVVADTGGWLSSRRVLLSPSVLERPDRLALALPVRLTRRPGMSPARKSRPAILPGQLPWVLDPETPY